MKAQEHTEEVLKSIHVLFSKAAPYAGSKFKVVIDKEKMMDLLKELNDCMYEMMDEYELTSKSREKAEREAQKQGDELAFEARKNAEDIYAASLMYSDRALVEIQDIMKDAENQIDDIRQDVLEKLKEKRQVVRDNQLELKGRLNTLIDTQKYLRLIEDENIRIAKESEQAEPYSKKQNVNKDKVVPEIKINENYFIQTGQNIENFSEIEEDLEKAAIDAEKLDEEYFAWKKGEEVSEEKPAKKKGFGLFGKKSE